MPEPAPAGPGLSLDDRRLLVELQSLGVRVLDGADRSLPGRRGGAGPSDALFLWVRGLPLTVPSHAAYVDASPYTLRLEGRHATLHRDGELVGPVTVPPRPRIYDMQTADGVRRCCAVPGRGCRTVACVSISRNPRIRARPGRTGSTATIRAPDACRR